MGPYYSTTGHTNTTRCNAVCYYYSLKLTAYSSFPYVLFLSFFGFEG